MTDSCQFIGLTCYFWFKCPIHKTAGSYGGSNNLIIILCQVCQGAKMWPIDILLPYASGSEAFIDKRHSYSYKLVTGWADSRSKMTESRIQNRNDFIIVIFLSFFLVSGFQAMYSVVNNQWYAKHIPYSRKIAADTRTRGRRGKAGQWIWRDSWRFILV